MSPHKAGRNILKKAKISMGDGGYQGVAMGLSELYDVFYLGKTKAEAKAFIEEIVKKFGTISKSKKKIPASPKSYPEHLRQRLFPLVAPHFGKSDFRVNLERILASNLKDEEVHWWRSLYSSFNGSNGKRTPAIKEQQKQNIDFYMTKAWSVLRYNTLRTAHGRCMACGRSAADGITLHVDHIKPRSKCPELELDPTNLQVLCGPCNEGKDNWDDTDWRPPVEK